MKKDDIKSFTRLVLKINTGLLMAGLVFLLLFGKYTQAIGLSLGMITSCITFVMHVANANKMGVSITKPVKNAIANTLLRLFVSSIAIMLALLVNWIDLIWTFIGLLVIKVVMIVTSFVMEIKKNRTGGEKKEC